MDFTELSNLVKTRRSIRRWKSQKVPQDLLLDAIELATWAPNGGNQQNWRFYIISNERIILRIADAVQTSIDEITSWPESRLFDDAQRWRQRASFFRDAPVLIGVAAAQYQSSIEKLLLARKDDDQAMKMQQWRQIADSRIQSVASAIAYLTLILHGKGLGAVWMTGPVIAKGEIEGILKIPPSLDFVALIPVGYPDELSTRERRPLREVCELIH